MAAVHTCRLLFAGSTRIVCVVPSASVVRYQNRSSAPAGADSHVGATAPPTTSPVRFCEELLRPRVVCSRDGARRLLSAKRHGDDEHAQNRQEQPERSTHSGVLSARG